MPWKIELAGIAFGENKSVYGLTKRPRKRRSSSPEAMCLLMCLLIMEMYLKA
jgi:hypothetical protein